MAHFAEIDSNNIVQRVLVVGDDQQHRGHDFLANDLGLGGTWIQTSYNCRGGIHYSYVPIISNDTTIGQTYSADGKPHMRWNYAGIGYIYDSTHDVFYPSCPYKTWSLDTSTFTWNSPVPRPDRPLRYTYSDEITGWQLDSYYNAASAVPQLSAQYFNNIESYGPIDQWPLSAFAMYPGNTILATVTAVTGIN